MVQKKSQCLMHTTHLRQNSVILFLFFASSDLRYYSKPEDSDYERIPYASLLKSSLTFKCVLF